MQVPKWSKTLLVLATAFSITSLSANPAEARWYRGYPYGYYHHHWGPGFGAGAAIGAGLGFIGGAVAGERYAYPSYYYPSYPSYYNYAYPGYPYPAAPTYPVQVGPGW